MLLAELIQHVYAHTYLVAFFALSDTLRSLVPLQIVVVDGFQTLQYAQRALMKPGAVGGRVPGPPGVVCVGLDVENCPTTTKAKLFQVLSMCVAVHKGSEIKRKPVSAFAFAFWWKVGCER